MEWLILDDNIKKSLMMMMMRALVPIQINCVYVIPMNLESFMSVSIDIIKINVANKFFNSIIKFV